MRLSWTVFSQLMEGSLMGGRFGLDWRNTRTSGYLTKLRKWNVDETFANLQLVCPTKKRRSSWDPLSISWNTMEEQNVDLNKAAQNNSLEEFNLGLRGATPLSNSKVKIRLCKGMNCKDDKTIELLNFEWCSNLYYYNITHIYYEYYIFKKICYV